MKTFAPLVIVLALTATLAAQDVPPALMVKTGEKSQPLGLTKVDVDVRILGYVAETTTTMTFSNPADRVLEGDLYFPLPEGSTISGYALDIEGKMVDGVAVEKHKGREVFEKIVRQGIDPGLVEWTKGNNFKTRVFPIPAKGSRTVRVNYVTELVGGRRHPTAYHLPLKYKSKVAEFSLRVEVVKPKAAPKVADGGLANFAFERWRDSYVAATTLKDFLPTDDLVVSLPEVDKQNVLVEKAPDGEYYFVVHDFPPIVEKQSASPPPKHVVIYWDASGSRGGKDHQREIGLLQKCLMGKNVTVDLVLLRNRAEPPKRFVVEGAKAMDALENHPVIAELRNMQYDGGAQLGAIGPRSGGETPDFYLLFSDGISNFGRSTARGMKAPVYAISNDSTADHAVLRHLAVKSGGQYFNLKRLTDDDVLGRLGRSAFSFLSAEAEAAAEMFPAIPEAVSDRFTLVGKLTGLQAAVTLDYGFSAKDAQKREVRVSREDATEGTILQRLWA